MSKDTAHRFEKLNTFFKIKVKVFLVLLVFISCVEKESDVGFKFFEFSYDNSFETSFTLQFRGSDTIYIREHWNHNDIYDSLVFPVSKTSYIALINKEDKKAFQDLLVNTRLKEYESEYYEDYDDGLGYALYLDKDSIKKTIYVHSHKKNVPRELATLASWIYKWKSKAKLVKINEERKLTTSKFVFPPPPPVPYRSVQ